MTELTLTPQAEAKAERAIERYGHLLGRPGYVAQAELGGDIKVVPWEKSVTAGQRVGKQDHIPDHKIPVPDELIQQARDSLPPLRRRTPQERLKAMTDVLVEDAKRAYEVTGIPVIAESVALDICRLMASEMGRFISTDSVRRMTLDELRPWLERKAKLDFTRAGHKQKESDQRKSVLDWHGKANHEASVPSLNRKESVAPS